MKNLDEINQLISDKNFEDAKPALEEILNAEPQNIEAIKLLGLCNVNLGMFKQGQVNFETVVKYKPDDASSWFYLANCYDNLDDFLHAKSAYIETIKLRENYIEAYKNLCVVYMKTQEEAKAVETAKKALSINEEDYTLWYMTGTAYMSMSNFKESIPYLEKAVEMKPDHSQLYNNLGTAYLTCGDYEKAYNYYLKASDLDPTNSITYYNIASILQSQNKHKEACEFFIKAYDTEPEEHYLVSLALSEFKSENYEDAIKHYKILVSHHPEKHNFQYNLACCYEMVGEFNFAIGILDQLVLLNPKSVLMSQKLANLFLKTDQPLRAKEIYERIIVQGNVSPDIYYEFALICVKTNDLDVAESILKKVIDLDPNAALAHKDLGVIYLNKRLFDYAKEEFEAAYKIMPENFGIIFEYANFCHAINDYTKADDLYKCALSKNPLNPDVLTFNALNCLALRDVQEAANKISLALMTAPGDSFVMYTAGKIYYANKEFEKAKEYLVKAAELSPAAEVKNLLALTYFELGEFAQANVLFEKLLEDNAMNTNLLLSSAKCYEQLSDLNSAEKQVEKAIEIFPDCEEAHEILRRIS